MSLFIQENSNFIFNFDGHLVDLWKNYVGIDGSVLLPIDLESEVVGYETMKTDEIIDFSAVKTMEFCFLQKIIFIFYLVALLQEFMSLLRVRCVL